LEVKEIEFSEVAALAGFYMENMAWVKVSNILNT